MISTSEPATLDRRRQTVAAPLHERGTEGGVTDRWILSWLALALALALHVADEAANDFLAFWNPLALSLRHRLPALPLPTFSFAVWLGGLIAAVLVLLALSWSVWRGAAWMRPVSYVLAVIMLGNGALHIVGTVSERRLLPGVYSSPVLLVAAGVLFATVLGQHRGLPRGPG